MAGIQYATKFEKKTSDLMKARRKTKAATNQDYEWDGSETIKVMTLTDPDIVDYTPNGNERYGESSEIEDTVQTWPLTEDRAWTKTIDKKNIQDANGIRKPGKYLAQVTKNKMVPEIDAYILATIVTAGEVANRDDIVTDAATTSVNAYTNFVDITADITNNEAPEEGRVALMTAAYYNKLKQSGFVLDSESGQKSRHTGSLGQVDNCEVFIVPTTRMPAATDLVITHPSVTVAPEKLIDYKVHDNPVGISGNKIEYRHRYDAFVDTNLVNAVGIHKTA
jgi:hypothetical protein